MDTEGKLMAIEHDKVNTVKNSLKRFSIYVLAFLLLIGIAAGTPDITSYAPISPVFDSQPATQVFHIEVNQNVNVSWYVNGTLWANTYNKPYSTYTENDAVAGTRIVNATASNENGTVSIEWTWIVRRYGVNLTVDSTSRTSSAGINASYALVLHNNGTDTDTYDLTVVNADSASTAGPDISGNITLESGASQVLLLNVTNISAGNSGIFRVNFTARSNNDIRKVGYINTTTTVTAVKGINLTDISVLNKTTTSGTNATYYLSLANNGTDADTYNLAVTSGGASVASLNITSVSLDADESSFIMLNVTNTSAGIFYVNVTATSDGDATKFAYISTTTNVTALRGVNLTNISSLENTIIAGTNATYLFSLTNNGSDPDSYNLAVTPGGTSEASLNTTSPVSLNSNETMIFTLNVTNNSSGTYYVNVTASSNNDTTKIGYINTTTIVNNYRVNLTVDQEVKSTIAEINATYTLTLHNNGTATDTYNLTVSGGGASTATLNVTGEIILESNESRTLLLNVTDTTEGTFYVNVTASSNNDATKVVSINTTTTVDTATGSVNGTVTDVMLGTPIANVTIALTNTTGGTIQGETDSSGYYYLSGVVTGTYNPFIYTISASKINYTTNSSLTVTVLNSTISNTTNITLSAYIGTLTGAYIKNGTNIEVSGATVTITNSTFDPITRTTDSSGSYSVSLYPAIYTINVSNTGYSGNSTSAIVSSNISTTVSTISLSPNTVTVTANRTVGSEDSGQNVSFNLTVVNTGYDATYNVINTFTSASTIVTTTPTTLLLNTNNSTGYVIVEVNNSNFGGWPVTITISNSSQSKSADVTLTAIMRNSSANYTNDSISVIDNASVTGGATLRNTTVANATVTGAALENAIVLNDASVSGNDTDIRNTTVTGTNTRITDGANIRGDYGNSYIDNSTVGNATVVSSNLTGSTISTNATVIDSTLAGATVDNSSLTNVTVLTDSTITNVASLSNIALGGITITGDPNYEYEGKITEGDGWATYQNINFTKVYDSIRISQLVIEQSPNIDVTPGTNTSINDTSLGTSMNFSMTVNLTNPAVINISETGISPDGAGFSSGTQLGNFLVIRSNDTLNVTRHILRLYFDTDPSTYTGGVAIYYYNTTTSAWEVLTTTGSGTEGGRYYREAVPDHFSTFALVGTTMNQPSSTTGSSGDVGDGGVVTSEPYDNIARSETYKNDLAPDKPVVYTFKLAGHGIYEISVTGKESENNMALRVEALKGQTRIAGISAPPGTVYMNVNVWSGSKNIEKGQIKFKIENTWISNNKFESGDLLLVKWDGSQWEKLVTLETMKDDVYSFYEANTDGIGSFAITALKGLVVPTNTPVPEDIDKAGTPVKPPAGTENPIPVPTKKIPGFEAIIAVSSIILLAACHRLI